MITKIYTQTWKICCFFFSLFFQMQNSFSLFFGFSLGQLVNKAESKIKITMDSPPPTCVDSGSAHPVSVTPDNGLYSPRVPTGDRSAPRPATLPPDGDYMHRQRPLATQPTSSCQTIWVCANLSPLILPVIHSMNP